MNIRICNAIRNAIFANTSVDTCFDTDKGTEATRNQRHFLTFQDNGKRSNAFAKYCYYYYYLEAFDKHHVFGRNLLKGASNIK